MTLVRLAWLVLLVAMLSAPLRAEAPAFRFEPLPAPPPALAGAALGRQGDTLLLVGGGGAARGAGGGFPATIHALLPGAAGWREAGELPLAVRHAAAVSHADGVLLIGGETAAGPSSAVTRVAWREGRALIESLPDLPVPLARPGAATVGSLLYVAGGEAFLRLDLSQPAHGWQSLPRWRGPPLAAPRLAALFEEVFVFETDAAAPRNFHRYHARTGWRGVTPAPGATVGTALAAFGDAHVFTFGGPAPGGAGGILAYHTVTDTWIHAGDGPGEPLAAPLAVGGGDRIVLLDGTRAWRVEVVPLETNYGWIDHVVVGLYLLGMVGMGLWFTTRERSTKDYFRGGQRIPWWATGMSLFATGASAISLLAMPGKSYAGDWTYFSISVYAVLLMPIGLYVLAPLVRKLDVSTANEYLELRFGLTARMIGSAIFIVGQVLGRMGPVMLLPAIAMAAITGIDIATCIIVMGVVTTLYTFLGGLSAVIWTDTVQGFVMIATLVGCLALVWTRIDLPLGEIFALLDQGDKLHTFDWEWDITYPTVWMVFLGTFMTGLMGIADQNYIQRVQCTPTLREARMAIATQMAVAVPINLLLFGLGTALFLFYREHPAELNPHMKTDGIFPFFAAQQLPPGISGVVVAALLAATMSTISSSICSVANLGVDDFYRRFWRGVSDQAALRMGRILTAAVGLLGIGAALFLANSSMPSVWDLALLVTGLISNGIVGLFGLGLLTRRAHQTGAIIGMTVGMSVVFALQRYTPVTFWLYALVGSAVTFAVGYLLSLVLPGRPRGLDGLTIFTLHRPREQL